MALISVSELTLGYESGIIAEDLNFEINRGDYVCIVGENGSGKSTLMKTLLGLNHPLKGKVTLGDGLKKNGIGYLPQQTPVQKDFPASVREIVMSGCQAGMGLRPFYSGSEKRRADENMKRMKVDGFAGKCYRQLSGGQQQRVLLARALCASRELLLLDEPVSGLDPKATADMYQAIKTLNDEGMTIIMISHDVNAAMEYADHILHMRRDPVFMTKEEYENSDIGRCYLAVK